jgi:TRAP-type mannitol/chloroaromatic compound transport system permease large subunit
MFGTMILFMLIGFPVAFSLAAVGLFFGILGINTGHFDPSFLQALPFRFTGSFPTTCCCRSPSSRLWVRSSSAAVLRKICLKAPASCSADPRRSRLCGYHRRRHSRRHHRNGRSLRHRHGRDLSPDHDPLWLRYAARNRRYCSIRNDHAADPAFLVLIVLADQLGRSVGDMYLGAIGPSILQVVIFLLYIVGISIPQPQNAPIPESAREPMDWKLVSRVLWGMIPSIVLIFLVLGTIGLGLATPTEAGAMGAVGAMVLAAMHRRLTWPLVEQAMTSTMRLTAMVVFILIGSTCFSLVFQGMDGARWIEHLLTGLPGGVVGFLIFVNIFVFFLAFFLDFFEIAFIIIPLLAPVAAKLGIDLVWFGVLLCVNMQTSFMHPPFGFALFYLRGIAPPEVKSSDIYWGAMPWVLMQVILVIIVIYWPGAVTYWIDNTKVDTTNVKIEIPQIEIPQLDLGPSK